MSEDEAFIRAIVSAPGDDLPRLVYADWLDERADPRGAYLRAEAEWAKGRREVGWAPPTAEDQERWAVPTLRQMATGLDPVWAARVSRPPEGVCCDHLTFTRAGKRLTLSALRTCEKRLGTTFPPDVLAFLINYNGGQPEPCKFRPRNSNGTELAVEWFLPATAASLRVPFDPVFGDDIETYMPILHNAVSSRDADRQPWQNGLREYIPLARVDTIGVVGFGLHGRRTGLLYHINRPTLGTASPPRKVADSLPDFLCSIRKHSEYP